MSMHEFEDLVADSIRALDAHYPDPDPRVRGWVVALFRFQGGFDCSFTHFRVMDILLRRGFTYRFPVDQHPDHAGRREYFDGLEGFTALRVFDEDDDDFDGYATWLEDGYVDPPYVYCDAGTDLWRRMSDEGRLTGEDAVAPRRVSLVETVAAVARAAEDLSDHGLIADWYALGPHMLLNTLVSLEDLQTLPGVSELRSIAHRTGGVSLTHEPVDDLETWWATPSGSRA
ncbi:hypothetical protein [Streptosporangium roseum]|uniref:Uncharacterized protein n=1 Tax=Streptosporangium roseum (strain ATCC 12428 / DSM 43021 / JCM 3005 / KCTC 9067 / NCIMB 10171 / NRRL 2505 / NI 9100) TaxID=479432 RepID=D2ATP4_STRRD|nr:hypothetical protein [Streptosporangium roseum]ACZ86764.1 conserved hypothetical protein [Streptosporangium roseum DSM 43021]